jgi:hypothetical protein
LTLVVPYRGSEKPEACATLPAEFTVGLERVELRVEAFGKAWQVGRDLGEKKAWSRAAASPDD